MDDFLNSLRNDCTTLIDDAGDFCDDQDGQMDVLQVNIRKQFAEKVNEVVGTSDTAAAVLEEIERRRAEEAARAQALPPGDTEKAREKRRKIREEFLETEDSFIKGLKILEHQFIPEIKTFIDKLKEERNNKKSKRKSLSLKQKKHVSIIDQEETIIEYMEKYFFKIIPKMIRIHENFYADLQAAQQHPRDPEAAIAQAMIEACDAFESPYQVYVSRYKKISKTVQDFIASYSDLNDAINQVSDALKEQNMRVSRLTAFLITPVQRIPRYQLLLRELESKANSVHKEILVQAKERVIALSKANDRFTYLQTKFSSLELHSKIFKIQDLNHHLREIVHYEDCKRLKTRMAKNVKIAKCQFYLFTDLLFCAYEGRFSLIPFYKQTQDGLYQPTEVTCHRFQQIEEVSAFSKSLEAINPSSPSSSLSTPGTSFPTTPTADASYITIVGESDSINLQLHNSSAANDVASKIENVLMQRQERSNLPAPFISITKANIRRKRRTIIGGFGR